MLPAALSRAAVSAEAASGEILTAAGVSAAKAPTSIKVKGKATIMKGKKVTFKVSVKPSGASKDVTWSSSNPAIATVKSNGEVSGKKAGTVTITAASKLNPKIKGTYTVTVSDTRAESVEILDAPTVMLRSDSVQLKAKAYPGGALQEFEWSSSDESVLKVNAEGKVTAKKAGVAKIKVKATDGSKKKDSVVIRVIDSAAEKSKLLAYLRKAQASGSSSYYSGGSGKIAAVVYTGTNTSSLSPTVSYLNPDSSYFAKLKSNRMADCLEDAGMLLIVWPSYVDAGTYYFNGVISNYHGYTTYTHAAIVDLQTGSVIYKATVATNQPPSTVYSYSNYYGTFEGLNGVNHLLNLVQ